MSPPSRGHSLTEGPIARTLVLFSLPILGSNVLQSLNVSVNSVWIGHYLGEAALTASSNANLVLFFLLGTVFGISMASTILIGQAMGARNIDQAKRVVGTGVTFFVGLSALVAVLGFVFTPEILALMHTPADAVAYAVAYLRVIFVALPAMYFYSFLMMTLRGAGDSHTPFLFMLLSVGLDITLNPLLIFGIGPLPALGIAGSAAATLVAQAVALLALVAHLYRRKHFLCLHRGEWHYLRPDFTLLRALVTKGLPMGMQMIVVSLSGLIMIGLINAYGSRVTAAYGAALQLWRYIQMPAIAVGSAVASMAAQNVGAGLWRRVSRVAAAGVIYNMVLTGSLVLVIYFFSRHAIGLFLPHDSEALDIAEHLNGIVVWSFLLISVCFVLFGVIRSTGAVVPPLVILAVALLGVRVPFAWAMRAPFGADAVWWSYPLGTAVALVLSVLYYRFGRWRHAHMLKPARGQVSTLGVDKPTVMVEPPAD